MFLHFIKIKLIFLSSDFEKPPKIVQENGTIGKQNGANNNAYENSEFPKLSITKMWINLHCPFIHKVAIQSIALSRKQQNDISNNLSLSVNYKQKFLILSVNLQCD